MSTPANPAAKPWLKHYPAEVPHRIDFSHPKTLVEMFNETVVKFPENIALHFMGKDIPYKHLHKFTRRLAIRLSQMDVKKDDRVALLMPNCPQAVISYYAILMLGAMVVPCNPLYTERELLKQISGAAVVITLDLFYAKVKRVRELLADEHSVQNIIVARFPEFLPMAKSLFYPIGYPMKLKGALKEVVLREQDCLAHQDEACVLEARKEEEKLKGKLALFNEARVELRKNEKTVHFFRSMVFAKVSQEKWDGLDASFPSPTDGADMLFTSGTTGISKGAKRLHSGLWTNTRQISAWFYDAKPGKEIFLGALPLFHTFGITTMNLCIALGGKLVLVPEASDIKSLGETTEKQEPTVLTGTPKLYRALARIHKPKQDWSSIKYCISGGAKLDTSIIEPFEKITGGKLVEGFGQTEAPVTHCNPLSGMVKAGSIGVPLPETNAKIMTKNIHGQYYEAKVGEPGALWVSGPQVMSGYFDALEETTNVFVLDDYGIVWLKTGDIALMDEDGYFFIKGREKNMILADDGYNIYPLEIEEVLRLHPAVLEAAVISLPLDGKEAKEVVTACVVLQKGYLATQEELLAHCKKNLAYYKVPRAVIFRTELPTTMKGDIIGYKLREEELAKRAQKVAEKK